MLIYHPLKMLGVSNITIGVLLLMNTTIWGLYGRVGHTGWEDVIHHQTTLCSPQMYILSITQVPHELLGRNQKVKTHGRLVVPQYHEVLTLNPASQA